jgi:hypothetical protein
MSRAAAGACDVTRPPFHRAPQFCIGTMKDDYLGVLGGD